MEISISETLPLGLYEYISVQSETVNEQWVREASLVPRLCPHTQTNCNVAIGLSTRVKPGNKARSTLPLSDRGVLTTTHNSLLLVTSTLNFVGRYGYVSEAIFCWFLVDGWRSNQSSKLSAQGSTSEPKRVEMQLVLL